MRKRADANGIQGVMSADRGTFPEDRSLGAVLNCTLRHSRWVNFTSSNGFARCQSADPVCRDDIDRPCVIGLAGISCIVPRSLASSLLLPARYKMKARRHDEAIANRFPGGQECGATAR